MKGRARKTALATLVASMAAFGIAAQGLAWSPYQKISRLRVWPGNQVIIWLENGAADGCRAGSHIVFNSGNVDLMFSALLSAKLADRRVSILAATDASGGCAGRSIDFE